MTEIKLARKQLSDTKLWQLNDNEFKTSISITKTLAELETYTQETHFSIGMSIENKYEIAKEIIFRINENLPRLATISLYIHPITLTKELNIIQNIPHRDELKSNDKIISIENNDTTDEDFEGLFLLEDELRRDLEKDKIAKSVFYYDFGY